MDWDRLYAISDSNEKPLDYPVPGGGYCSIFRRVACIGDSLASGEFESADEKGKKKYHDIYEYSWGQFMARMCGFKAYNFSMGGMTAENYCRSFADQRGFWSSDLAAQAYIIALGVNDLHNRREILFGETPVGSADEIDLDDWRNNPRNFAGYYATIIQRYREIQPRAKFFLVTFPRHPRSHDTEEHRKIDLIHRDLLYAFAKKFPNTYVIDLYEYGPTYDEDFKKTFFGGSHMNAMGYYFTAQILASYIDWIIRKHPRDFCEVGFIGTDYHIPKD